MKRTGSEIRISSFLFVKKIRLKILVTLNLNQKKRMNKKIMLIVLSQEKAGGEARKRK